ncbi:MarR family winged helix-turn-helix transcriptional regulator [Thermosporothrix hazakensis]|uniref:MarR family winged helix-turn-helix transcriptional regulator n=1 Tax=Thermosporothrix hazakensis TaxID=644383 RepID=UPI001B87AB46|nr:MarR family transcriptional regulator [Thermosporothrix hazakensis]
MVLTHLHRDMSRAFSKQIGMSFSRLLVLHELWHTGEISQTELASRLSMEGALLTRFVKQMEAAGLITRRVDPRDNRFTLVSLAPAGQQVLSEMGIHADAFEAGLLEGVSKEDLASMVRTMKQIQDNLSRRLEHDG